MPERTSRPRTLLGSTLSDPDWARRRDIALAIIGWLVILAFVVWLAAHIAGALLTLVFAALLAYAIYPVIRQLSRWIPRPLAIAIAYIVAIAVLFAVLYLVVNTAILQLSGLIQAIHGLLSKGVRGDSPIIQALGQLGITPQQVTSFTDQLGTYGQQVAAGVATGAVPLIAGVFGGLLEFILVIVLSIYLAVDGYRAVTWLRTHAPIHARPRINFLLTTLERVVGGYIRGQITLSALIGLLVGVSMAVLQVPYALLLGVLAFFLEFIPTIGVFISGAACVLLALTKGPLLAVIVLAVFIIVHIIEGDVVGPRVVGRAIGLHPAVSIFALLAGAEVFGLWGAILAAPLAGVLQAILVEAWREWRETHPNQFPEQFGTPIVPVTTDEALAASPVASSTTDVWPPEAVGLTEMEMSGAEDPGATSAIGPPVDQPPGRH
jgi:predicted PurR-regulated permease PerM